MPATTDCQCRGILDASGAGTARRAAPIAVTGGTVNVLAGADLDASGSTGGGTIEIGGGSHGQGPLAHAQTANVGNANVTASAVLRGDGGNVVTGPTDDHHFAARSTRAAGRRAAMAAPSKPRDPAGSRRIGEGR